MGSLASLSLSGGFSHAARRVGSRLRRTQLHYITDWKGVFPLREISYVTLDSLVNRLHALCDLRDMPPWGEGGERTRNRPVRFRTVIRCLCCGVGFATPLDDGRRFSTSFEFGLIRIVSYVRVLTFIDFIDPKWLIFSIDTWSQYLKWALNSPRGFSVLALSASFVDVRSQSKMRS